jgi:hypothetical protein
MALIALATIGVRLGWRFAARLDSLNQAGFARVAHGLSTGSRKTKK